MRVSLRSLLGGLAVLLGYTAVVTAAPVMPGAPIHQWMFDSVDSGNGYAMYDEGTSSTPLNLYNQPQGYGTAPGYANTVLVGSGDQLGITQPSNGGYVAPDTFMTLPGKQAVPFLYTGNKSAALDGKAGNNTYPTRTHAGGVSAGVAATTDLLGAAGTVSMWYKPIRHDGYGDGYLFTFRNSGGNGERLYLLEPGTASTPLANSNLTFRNATGGDQTLSLPGFKMSTTTAGNAEPDANETWYNIVTTWDSNALKVYKNGALAGTMPSTTAVFNGFQPDIFEISSYSNTGSAAPGLYDEFAIWNTALSADNVSWLYANSLNDLVPVPEPATAGLLLAGLIGLGIFRRRRSR